MSGDRVRYSVTADHGKVDYLTYVRNSRTDFCEAQPILYPRAQLPRLHSVQAVRNGGGIQCGLGTLTSGTHGV